MIGFGNSERSLLTAASPPSPLWGDEQHAHPLVPVFLRERLAGNDDLQAEPDVVIVRRVLLDVSVPAHHLARIGKGRR
jgi:hypothetical protein